MDALEAAVFVRSLRSAQELIGPVVEDFAQQLMADDDVVSAIKLREGRRGHTNVTSMRPTKSPPGGAESGSDGPRTHIPATP